MAFLTLLTHDTLAEQAIWSALRRDHVVARSSSWGRLLWMVRERPVTGVVLDSAALGEFASQEVAIIRLLRCYPSLATVVLARPGMDVQALFRLGKAGLTNLVLLPIEGLAGDLSRAVSRAFHGSADALVTRVVSAHLPGRETHVLRRAIEGVQLGWGAEDLADRVGLTRAHLSVRLRACGLPSAGHLLIWAKLFHAGRWIGDPMRTADSIARQLDYSSGAAFRRVLRNYLGLTPTELRDAGGLGTVLDGFLEACDLGQQIRADRSVA